MGFLSKVLSVAAPVAGFALGGPQGAALGAQIGGAFSTQDSQDFATSSAANANAFTKEQLQNRHQWEVADLKAAGLNPILSALKGAPSIGGSAQPSTGAGVAGDAATLTNSSSQARAIKLAEDKLQAEIDLLKANSYNARQQGKNAGATGDIKGPLAAMASSLVSPAASASATASKNVSDLLNIRDIISKVKAEKSKPDYVSPSKRIWNKLKGN